MRSLKRHWLFTLNSLIMKNNGGTFTMENKVIVQGRVIEVTMLRKTGRMLDGFGGKIKKAAEG